MKSVSAPEISLSLRDWATLRLHLIWVYAGVPRMLVAGPDMEQTTQFYLLKKGSVTVITDLAQVTASRGDWVITTSRKREHRFSRDAEIISLNFKVHWADDRPLFPDDPPLRVAATSCPLLETTAQRLLQVVGGFPVPYTPQAGVPATRCTSLAGYQRVCQLTLSLLRAYVTVMQGAGRLQSRALEADPRVAQAQRILDTHPLTWWVDHEKLARGLGLSESHLSRLFVAQLAQTPRQYELQRRLMRARELIGASELPVKQVAYLLGFRQPSHFTTWFGKHAGLSPRAYRSSRPGYELTGPTL